METTTTTIARPTLISYPEFKKRLADSDGFGKTRRIIFYDPDGNFPFKYMIPMIGKKELCYKAAYYLLFIAENGSFREQYIQEGKFKYPLSYNFSRAFDISYQYSQQATLEAHAISIQKYKEAQK